MQISVAIQTMQILRLIAYKGVDHHWRRRGATIAKRCSGAKSDNLWMIENERAAFPGEAVHAASPVTNRHIGAGDLQTAVPLGGIDLPTQALQARFDSTMR